MALFENKTYVNGKEILKFFGVTSETIKDWMKNKDFPKPIKSIPKTLKPSDANISALFLQ